MSSIYGKRVKVYHYVEDTSKDKVKDYAGHFRHPRVRVVLGIGICVGLSTSYEQFSYGEHGYCGQFPVMVVIINGKFEAYTLDALEEVLDE